MQQTRASLALLIYCSLSTASISQTKLNNENLDEYKRLLSLQETQKSVSIQSLIPPPNPETTFQRLMNWNLIALETSALDHTPVEAGSGDDPRRFAQQIGPHRSSYAMAITHIAMFEAVNSVHQTFQSYTKFSKSEPNYKNSRIILDRAIAQSAHRALVALYPYQKDRLDGLLSIDIARMPKEPTVPETEIQIGIALGNSAADSIISLRAGDGSADAEPTFGKDFSPKNCPDVKAPCPGVWKPDPVSKLTVALGAHWSKVPPFVMKSASQFRPAPPPALNSPEYASAYNEVRSFGSKLSSTRRDFQEFEGVFWAYDGTPNLCAPPRLYNKVATTLAYEKRLGSLPDMARFLALINTAMADAGIAAWEAKYYYQLWRPIGGIQGGGPDGSSMAASDPTWEPLGGPLTNARGPNFSPPFPAYPSGHATFGGAIFGILRKYWPDNTAFTFVSDEFNGLNYAVGATEPRPRIPQSFVSMSHAEYSNAKSRIWLGIHWQFDADAGIKQGNEIAEYVFANAFQPIGP